MPTTHSVSVNAYVDIIVNDNAPDDIFTRAEDVEGFQKPLYGDEVKDKDTVLQHWAYNAVANGVQSPHRLDGWADLDRDAVQIRVTDVTEGF